MENMLEFGRRPEVELEIQLLVMEELERSGEYAVLRFVREMASCGFSVEFSNKIMIDMIESGLVVEFQKTDSPLVYVKLPKE